MGWWEVWYPLTRRAKPPRARSDNGSYLKPELWATPGAKGLAVLRRGITWPRRCLSSPWDPTVAPSCLAPQLCRKPRHGIQPGAATKSQDARPAMQKCIFLGRKFTDGKWKRRVRNTKAPFAGCLLCTPVGEVPLWGERFLQSCCVLNSWAWDKGHRAPQCSLLSHLLTSPSFSHCFPAFTPPRQIVMI